jgi:hypothetical protein
MISRIRAAWVARSDSEHARPMSRFADLKANLFAAWVRTASDQKLRSVMDSRIRGMLLWQIFRTMRQRARPDVRLDAVVEFRISRRGNATDHHQLKLAGGRCTRPRHNAMTPDLTLELESVDFLRLVGGAVTPQRLVLAGKLKPRGDLLLALALPTALRLPR